MAATWKTEVENKHHYRHQVTANEWVGGSTPKQKTQQRIHGKFGIFLGRHLGLRLLLLWYKGEANRTLHCASQDQLWQQNYIMLTWCSWVHRGGSHCNNHSDEWCTRAHNCHRWSSAFSNVGIIRYTVQRKTSTSTNFLWLKIGIPLVRTNSQYHPGRGALIPPGATPEVYMTICIIRLVWTYFHVKMASLTKTIVFKHFLTTHGKIMPEITTVHGCMAKHYGCTDTNIPMEMWMDIQHKNIMTDVPTDIWTERQTY